MPLIYDHLRRLAAQKLAPEPAGISIQATAPVHEAYVRLEDTDTEPRWVNRGHDFAAAAEPMLRILIENAGKKIRIEHGGEFDRIELIDVIVETSGHPERRKLDSLSAGIAASADSRSRTFHNSQQGRVNVRIGAGVGQPGTNVNLLLTLRVRNAASRGA